MATAAVAILFVLMVIAPCVVALRSSRKHDDIELEEFETETAPEPVLQFSRAERLANADHEMQALQDLAREAHWAALAAAARAARLRAEDALLEARAAEVEYLKADHPSLDFPRSRVHRIHAA